MEAKKIIIEMEDGTTNVLEQGIALNIKDNNVSMNFINMKNIDIVKAAHGIIATVGRLGLTVLVSCMKGDNL